MKGHATGEGTTRVGLHLSLVSRDMSLPHSTPYGVSCSDVPLKCHTQQLQLQLPSIIQSYNAEVFLFDSSAVWEYGTSWDRLNLAFALYRPVPVRVRCTITRLMWLSYDRS